jgi:hypothetical protein
MTQDMKPREAWARNPAHQHQAAEIPIRGFVIFLIGFIVTAIALHVLLWALFGVLVRGPRVQISPLAEGRQVIPPEPRLQGSVIHPELPAMDMQAMINQENGVLSTYAWQDAQQGIARIPIERAMVLLLRRGLPTTQPSTMPGPVHEPSS